MDGLEKRSSGGYDRAHNSQAKKSSAVRKLVSKIGSGAGSLIRWIAGSRLAQVMLIVLLLIGGGFGLYKIGYSRGEQAQKALDEKSRPKIPSRQSNSSSSPRPSSAITSYVGEITEISAAGLTVKTTDNATHKVSFGQSLVVTDVKGAKSDAKNLKKGQKIAVSGTDKDGELSATRIRIR